MWNSTSSRVGSAPSSRTKSRQKLKPAMPPRSTSARNISSVRLRGWPHTAREFECDAANGRELVFTTSQKLVSFRCDTSITMRRCSIARTTWAPNVESPSVVTLPDAIAFLPFHVSVSIFTPASAAACRRSSEPSMNDPPSTVNMPAHFPLSTMPRMSRASCTCSMSAACSVS